MLEVPGGGAITDMLVQGGRRRSLYRAYAHPFSDRPNLTIMTGAHVRRIPIDQRRAIGVDGSILPRVTTGNTQAPCAIIGEQGATRICAEHGL